MLESLPGPVGAQTRAARGPGKQQWISTVWVHRTFCTLWFFSGPYVSRTRFRTFFAYVRCSDMYCFAPCRSLSWNEHKINGKAKAETENRLPPPARPRPDQTCLDPGPARAGLLSMNMKNGDKFTAFALSVDPLRCALWVHSAACQVSGPAQTWFFLRPYRRPLQSPCSLKINCPTPNH